MAHRRARTTPQTEAAAGPASIPLGRSLGRAHKLVRAWGDRALIELGSSVTEWIVLFHINDAVPPGASQTEIARFSDMGGPALVRHIDRLEGDGLVTRTHDRTDRRVIRLNLTDAGRARYESIRAVMAECDRQLRTVISPADAVVLQRGLDALFEFCLDEVQGSSVAWPAAPPPVDPADAAHPTSTADPAEHPPTAASSAGATPPARSRR